MSPATPELDLRGNVSLVCLMPCQELTDICSHFPQEKPRDRPVVAFCSFLPLVILFCQTGSYTVAQVAFQLQAILLSQPPKGWDYSYVPPKPSTNPDILQNYVGFFFHLPCVYMVCACVYVRIHVHVCVGALACTRLCRSQRLTSGVFNHLHNLLVWSCFEIESHYVTLSCLKVAE